MTSEFEFRPQEIPPRERTWADHDEPWRYAEYHLTPQQRVWLLLHWERLRAEEWRLPDSQR